MAVNGLYLIVKNGKNGEEYISLMNNQVKEYNCILNSKDDVLHKDNDIMPELHLKGQFEGKNNELIYNLVKWSLSKHEKAKDAYKYLEFGYAANEIIERQYIFPEAFVVDFSENGTGAKTEFSLFIKQKSDKKGDFVMNVNLPMPEEWKDGGDE